MIPDLDPDLESDFQLFGYSGSYKKQHHNTYRGFTIPALDLNPESDYQRLPFPNPVLNPIKSGITTPLMRNVFPIILGVKVA